MFFKLAVFLFIIKVSVCEINLCDSVCMCRFVKHDFRDFLAANIDCSYNNIEFPSNYTLPDSSIVLDLSNNEIKAVLESQILKSNTLEALYLKNNKIKSIEINALVLPELKILDLSANELDFLDPEVFSKTKKLEYLNLSSNLFQQFPSMFFHHLSVLHELVLDNNDVGEHLRKDNLFQRNGLALTNKIQSISISNISLNIVPDNFLLSPYDLRRLTLSNNNITIIPELPYMLEYIDLSDNPINEIYPEDFPELPMLKELRLNNLNIKEIPDYMFANMKYLVKLNLERNSQLVNFSKYAFGDEVLDDPDDFTLEFLSLRGSRFTSLDKELAMPFGQLSKLDLQGNPWKCDCKLLWVRKLQIPSKDYEHLRCGSPENLYNKKIFEIKPKYFKCDISNRHLPVVVGAVAFCVCLSLVALWFFFFLPKYQDRSEVIRQMYSPHTVYNLLPLSTISNERY